MSIKQKREDKPQSADGCKRCYKLTGVGHEEYTHTKNGKGIVTCDSQKNGIAQCPCVGGYVE